MTYFVRKHSLLLLPLMLLCATTLISCGQGSSSSTTNSTSAATPTVFPTSTESSTPTTTPTLAKTSVPTGTPTAQPAVCASCITVGKPVLTASGQGADGKHYMLSFVITNSGDGVLNKFTVNIQMNNQTGSNSWSYSQTRTDTTAIAGHSQLTYQIGGAMASIVLPNPPPSTVHVKISLGENGSQLTGWEGQVSVPA